jgi:pyruvate dehydrogenase (quinone)
MLGLNGVRIERPEEIGAAWDAAFASDRPFVIDAVTDPNVPTIPPDPSEEVKESIAKALGEEPDAASVVRQVEREGTER